MTDAPAPKRRRKGSASPERETEVAHVGRPTLLTPELADEICDRIACGETLPNICLDEHIPNERTIRRWAREQDQFRLMYARAREEQMHSWADEIVTISDDGSRDYKIDGEGGGARLVPDHDHIQRSKLRVDTRKFLMAKIAPKTFGEKVDIDLRAGKLDEMTDDQLAKHIANLAAGLGIQVAGLGEGAGGEEEAFGTKPPRLI